MVEHLLPKQRVVGSSPIFRSITKPDLSGFLSLGVSDPPADRLAHKELTSVNTGETSSVVP